MKKNVELFFHFLGNAYLCPRKGCTMCAPRVSETKKYKQLNK